MSLDIYLVRKGVAVFEANITHNLANMADAAHLYIPMWKPNEYDLFKARDVLPFLRLGALYMLNEKEKLLKYNPPNGWGNYDILLECVKQYMRACNDNKKAIIEVSR